MFNEASSNPALEARVADLEAQLLAIGLLVSGNATDAQALVDELAGLRAAGDAAAQAALVAERAGRVETVRQVNDLVGDLAVRMELGDRVNTKIIEQKAVLAGYALSLAQQAVDQAWLAVAQTLVVGPYKSQAAGEAATAVGDIFHVIGPGNAYATPYERTAGGSTVAGQPIASPASIAAVQPSALAALAAARRSVPAAKGTHMDRTGGTATEELAPGLADALTRFVGRPVRGSYDLLDRIDQIDTLARVITHWYDQDISGSLHVSALTRMSGGVEMGGADPQLEVIDKPLWTELLAFWALRGRNGSLIEYDGPNDRIIMGVAGAIPQVDGALWQHPDGTLRVNRPVGWYTGKHSYLSESAPPPQCLLRPRVRYVEDAPELATRVFILIPSVCKVEDRLFFAWCGDAVLAEEGAGNFIILAYSDDGGLTKTEFAYVEHPEPSLGRTMMPQLWRDLDGRLQLVFSMNYAFVGIAGGDDRHGAWCMPIDFPLGDKPRCGRAWLVSTYGIPGRPALVDDRMLINIDLVENPTSGLPTPGPISAWRGKSIFEIDTRRRSAIRVGGIVNSVAYASYQECSTVQLRDGSLLTSFRTRTPGGMTQIARSPDGDPNNYGAVANWAALPPNPGTRSALVMSANGRPVVAWNSHVSERTNMTLAILDDSGSTILQSVLIDQLTVTTSYPSIWCDGDDIYVVYDRGRTSNKQIILVKVSEAALLAGNAVPAFFTIEDQ